MLLTLNDLIDFYSKRKKSMHFNSEQSGEPIVVQVNGIMKFEKSNDTEGLTAVRLQACHTDRNLNSSSISYEVMNNKMLPSFKNRPILGYIHDIDGKPQFYGHNMHIDDETDEIIYDEIAVGIIPETNNAKLEYDKENDRYNVIVDGYIFNEYTKAAEILEREQECSVSVEIAIRSMSYSAKEKCLVIEDGYFSGVTILGYDDNGNVVKPGMAGSNIKLKDFSESNNSMFSDMDEDEHSKLIEMLEQLNTKIDNLSNFTIQSNAQSKLEEGGNETVKLNELLEKYGKTVEDITFDYENLSDEELEVKFEEVFGEDNADGEGTDPEPTSDGDGDNGEDNVNPEDNGTNGDVTDNADDDMSDDSDGEPSVDDNLGEDSTDGETSSDAGVDSGVGVDASFEDNISVKPEKYSITMSDGSVKEFALSLEDINNALWTLVNTTYGESDDTYYSVIVYEDNTLIMVDWWNAKAFRQKFNREDDNFSLVGDRVKVTQIWVSEDEEQAINEMKANYSSISAELNSYKEAESIADKMTVFEDKAYASYLETDEFKSLMKKETVKQFSKEELVEKADAALGKLVKTSKTFSMKEENVEPKKPAFFAFAQQTKDTSFLDGLLKK